MAGGSKRIASSHHCVFVGSLSLNDVLQTTNDVLNTRK
jgi:hypothetical protein